MSIKNDLKKALHKAIMKAYQSSKKLDTVNEIIQDLEDPNGVPEVSQSDLPAPSEAVLNKSPKKNEQDTTASEMHQQKQANIMAKLGQTPKTPKMAGFIRTLPVSSDAQKPPRPLKGFMQKKESKRFNGK